MAICKNCKYLDVNDWLKGYGYKCHRPRWKFRRESCSRKQLSTPACRAYEVREGVDNEAKEEAIIHNNNSRQV